MRDIANSPRTRSFRKAPTAARWVAFLGVLSLFASANAPAAELILKLFPTGEDCGYTVNKDVFVKHVLSCDSSAGPLEISAVEAADHRLSTVVVVQGDPSALYDAAHSALVDLVLKVEDLLLEPGGSEALLAVLQVAAGS